jgi:hypothetical protein
MSQNISIKSTGGVTSATIASANVEFSEESGDAVGDTEARRRGFFRVVSAVVRAYKALLPDERAAPYLKPVATLHVVAEATARTGWP